MAIASFGWLTLTLSLSLTPTLTLTLTCTRTLTPTSWHASNCTEVHFVDIGLMNSVIGFFPLRFGFASAVHALRVPGQP